jgi:methionine-rich copper-binding protein CopC
MTGEAKTVQKRSHTSASRLSALAIALFAVAAGVVVGTGDVAPASAHNYVVSTAPAADSTVTEQPGTVGLTTNDALLDAGGDANLLRISGPDGYYGDGCTVVEGPTATMNAELGAAGAYTVEWQVVSTDGHPISGQFAFTWQPAEGAELAIARAEPPVCGEAAPVTPGDATEEGGASSAPTDDATTEASAAPSESTDAADATEADRDDAADTAVGVIVGIGAALLVLVIAALVVVFVSRRRSRRQGENPQDADDVPDGKSDDASDDVPRP